MATKRALQYVSDSDGHPVGVIVPIELWHEIVSERETAYLLNSVPMRERLLKAKGSSTALSVKEVRSRLGI